MAATPENRTKKAPRQQDWFGDLFERVCEAGVQTFMIMILGNVALSILSGVVGRMIPSAPPGLESMTHAPGPVHVWWNAILSIKFYLLFAVLLYLSLREKYFAPAGAAEPPVNSRWRRIGRRFSENWFGSLVGNAFLAMGLATALAAIPKFSAWQWAWQWLTGFFSTRFDITPDSLASGGWMSHVKAWFNWYGDNQLRFNFWVIYLGAMCDDFGIPNFKSLARWLWQRGTKPKVGSKNDQATTNSA